MKTIYIKNMVCNRCILVVEQVAGQLGLRIKSISLGELVLEENPPQEKIQSFGESLKKFGFEILDGHKQKIIEKIKNTVIEYVHHSEAERKYNFSELLSSKLDKEYSYLSSLFSEVEGITIEKYLIAQKIEKVKELIIYDELSLSEIAYKMGYSSMAHLSSQFKKVTGLNPSHFKQIGRSKRKPLDQI